MYKNKTNILLSNFDLIALCAKFNIPLNEIENKDNFIMAPKEGAYIVNLQDSNKGPGTHWTCFIVNKNYVSYYDPFGLSMPPEIKRFIAWWDYKHDLSIIYSSDQIQPIISEFCGWYCLYFLYFNLVLHKFNNNHKYLMNKHNNIFNLQNKNLNDKILQKLIINIKKNI
jgi:hypothetical protein